MVGAPEIVSHYFSCSINHLTSLLGLPKYIGFNLYCTQNLNLTNISDIWDSVINGTVYINVERNLAILPLIKFGISLEIKNSKISEILISNRGSSKQNIINCQYELIENGFDEHAKWKP